MKIISVPHPTLRTVAQPITDLTPSVLSVVKALPITLKKQSDPPGVGLAAPQINHKLRAFATYLSADGTEEGQPISIVYLNPTVVATSPEVTFGPDPQEPILEGCLSIPKLYGPVPRFSWIEVEYQVIDHDQLVRQTARLTDFSARVFQHELDHLNGVLFTDYALKYDLPLYQMKRGSDRLVEIDPQIAAAF